MESWWYFVIAAALVLVVTFGCCVWCHCHERNNEIVVRRRSCVMVFPETSRDTDRIMDYDYQDGVDYAEGSQYDGGTGNPPVPRYGSSHPYGLDIPGGSTYDPQRTLQDNATAISEDGQQYHDGRDDVLGGACSQEKLEGATCSQYYQPTGSHRGSRQGSRGPPRSRSNRRGSRGQRRMPHGPWDGAASSGSQSGRPPRDRQGKLPVPARYNAMTMEEDVSREKY